MTHKIEVDDEIFAFLQQHAEPLKDDANSVLRKLLLNDRAQQTTLKSAPTTVAVPDFPSGVPAALEQILEVVYLVKKFGYDRKEATNIVAQRRRIAPQTVIDKYCRQLNKQAFEVDRMLDHDFEGFRELLKKVFVKHQNIIEDLFGSL